MASSAYLFESRPAMQLNPAQFRTEFGGPGNRRFWGANPQLGLGISYYLKSASSGAKVTIREAAGTAIREIPIANDDATSGIHRIYWDLRHEPLPPPRIPAGGGGGGGPTRDGPFVLPGAYEVALVVDGKTVGSRTVRVTPDSVMPMSIADRATLHATLVSLHDAQRAADGAADAVGTLSQQLASVQNAVQSASAPASVKATVDSLGRRLTPFRGPLSVRAPGAAPGGPGGFGGGGEQPLRVRIGALKREIMGSTSLPTELQTQAARAAREDLARLIEAVNVVITREMPALSRALTENKLGPSLTPLRPLAPLASAGAPR